MTAVAETDLHTPSTGSDVPAVVAVVVAHNPGDHFEQCLESLKNQDYENLSVLVVDAGSDEPIAERVAEALPVAYLHRLAGDPGFSVAANQALELVSGSPFLLFCHDDVVLSPDCLSILVSELYRGNAGIAGPKLVRWNDSRRLAQLGMGSDRFGVMVDQVEQGEFDQDQYDSVRQVFVAPGGVQLVRSDLFTALGGFDPTIKVLGEDLDFCWRAHIAGARVLVVPDARARHLESFSQNANPRERRQLINRHRLRTVLATADRRAMFTSVPLAFALLILEGLAAMLAGRRSQARDILAAIPWNLSRLDDIRRRRRLVRRTRSISNKDVAGLQARGSARLANFSRGQFSARQDRFSDMVGSVRSSFAGADAGNVRDATVITAFILLLLVFGSRHLLTRGVASVGQIPTVPAGRELLGEWLSGWRTNGTGGPGNAPTAFLFLALGRFLFFWAAGLFQTLVAVAPVLLAPVAMYRSLRPLGSSRAAAAAALVYTCCPLITSAFSTGQWEAMVIFAAAPYLIASMLKLHGVSPFGFQDGEPGPTIVDRAVPVRLIRYALLVAVVASFAPSVVPIAVATALMMIPASLLLANGRPLEGLGAAALAVIGPVALHGPWSFDVLQDISWGWLMGPQPLASGTSSMLDLIRFAPGSVAPQLLMFGFVALAVLGLVVSRTEVFHVSAHGWFLASSSWLVIWADRRGWIPVELPSAEAFLAIGAAGLCFAIAAGLLSLERDRLANDREAFTSRARTVTMAAGSVAVAAVFLSGLVSALDGAWGAPQSSFASSVEFLTRQRAQDGDQVAPGRVVWIGDADVLPAGVARSQGGAEYTVTENTMTDFSGRWHPSAPGSTAGIGRQIDLAASGQVVRLGRLLAPYGVDFVVVAQQLAPAPYDGPVVPPDTGLLRALSQQLDLERVPGVPDLVVFRNRSSSGVAPLLSSVEQAQATTAAEQLDVDLATGSAAVETLGPGEWTVDVPADTSVLVSIHNSSIEASGTSSEIISGFDRLVVIPSGPAGEVTLTFGSRLVRRLAIIAQFLLVAIGVIVGQTRREVAR